MDSQVLIAATVVSTGLLQVAILGSALGWPLQVGGWFHRSGRRPVCCARSTPPPIPFQLLLGSRTPWTL